MSELPNSPDLNISQFSVFYFFFFKTKSEHLMWLASQAVLLTFGCLVRFFFFGLLVKHFPCEMLLNIFQDTCGLFASFYS